MHSPVHFWVFLFGLAYMFWVVEIIAAAVNAPVGYEDEDGFHHGIEPVSATGD